MALPFTKDINDDRTPEGLNRHGHYQPSLETALCLASVFADLDELGGMEIDREYNEWLCFGFILETHS